MEPRRTVPSQLLVNGRPYTTSASTDVVRTWLRHGWQPPCRQTQERIKAQLNPLGAI